MKTLSLQDAYDWSDIERVLVLSPHLDDAVLSAAGMLDSLKGVVSRLVVTIACGNPVARSTGRARGRAGFASPSERRLEDIVAMKELDCNYVHLGFADCIYRRSPTTGELIYKGGHSRFSSIAVDDRAYVEELYLVLRRLSNDMGRVLVVAPLGIGGHVDHLICAQVALQLRGVKDTLFYEDVPYVFNPQIGSGLVDTPEDALARLGCEPAYRVVVRYQESRKVSLMHHYQTQVPKLFSNPDELGAELCARRVDGEPVEYFWVAKRDKHQLKSLSKE